jgi:hypothetical protein
MPPHAQLAFSMHSCGEKSLCHIPSDKEKQAKHKTEPKLQTNLWQPQNRPTHTKKKIKNLILLINKGLI